MNRKEKCDFAISKGFTYDKNTGNVYGVNKGIITKKANGYISLTLWFDNKRNYLYAHQFAWYVENKEIVDLIDHKNLIKTDNRIANLRSTTKQINALNSIAKGCCFSKRDNKWISSIMINGRKKHLGNHYTEKEAINNYQKNKIEILKQL